MPKGTLDTIPECMSEIQTPDLLRHAVATIAYRAAKTLRSAPAGFADVRAGPATRSAMEIVAHMADLMEWSARAVVGEMLWRDSIPASWQAEVDRFFAALKMLDDRLAAGPPRCPPDRLLQGPLADALTHIGQLATLRRLAGAGIRGESYFRADIAVGRVSPDQSPPAHEFGE
jgi:hypothetical protein